MSKLSFPKEKISILLLEGIHDNAVADLADHGYTNVTRLPKALDEQDLIERLAGVHMLGIRSRSQLDGTGAARSRQADGDRLLLHRHQPGRPGRRRAGSAIPVFNAPHSNTRSVAELVMGEIIMLMRGIWDKSRIVHDGGWMKSAKDSYEIRGKVLGIVGYGHIGTQLSVIAEALGMRVRFFDVQKKLALGNAQSCRTLDELLTLSDVVSLHVPDTAQTRDMIGPDQLKADEEGLIS